MAKSEGNIQRLAGEHIIMDELAIACFQLETAKARVDELKAQMRTLADSAHTDEKVTSLDIYGEFMDSPGRATFSKAAFEGKCTVDNGNALMKLVGKIKKDLSPALKVKVAKLVQPVAEMKLDRALLDQIIEAVPAFAEQIAPLGFIKESDATKISAPELSEAAVREIKRAIKDNEKAVKEIAKREKEEKLLPGTLTVK